jgi:hypothetical protein
LALTAVCAGDRDGESLGRRPEATGVDDAKKSSRSEADNVSPLVSPLLSPPQVRGSRGSGSWPTTSARNCSAGHTRGPTRGTSKRIVMDALRATRSTGLSAARIPPRSFPRFVPRFVPTSVLPQLSGGADILIVDHDTVRFEHVGTSLFCRESVRGAEVDNARTCGGTSRALRASNEASIKASMSEEQDDRFRVSPGSPPRPRPADPTLAIPVRLGLR